MSIIIPNTFANTTTDLALSDLDENFTVLVNETNSNTDRLDNINTGIIVNEDSIILEKNLTLPESTIIPENSNISGPIGSILVPGTISNCIQTTNAAVFSTTSLTPVNVTDLNVTITPK